MSTARCRISDYLGLVADETEETKFLSSIPWTLDALPQITEPMIKALRYEAVRFAELSHQPLFALLTVIRGTPPQHLREFILSARCQSYQNWELTLVDDGSASSEHLSIARRWANRDQRITLTTLKSPLGPSLARNVAVGESTGDFMIVTDGDGVLHPMALGVFARHINDAPKVNFLFANEAEINPFSSELTNFFMKPPFDLFTLLRVPYIGRIYAMKRDLVDAASRGGVVFRAEYDGIEEHDLLLRLALTGAVEARHVPLFTYYRRARSEGLSELADVEIVARRKRLVEEFIPRAYPGAKWTARVTEGRDPLASASIWLTGLPGWSRPKLLIVIPFKDHVETTIQCLESIERQEHGLDLVVALVNNRSIEPGTLPELRSWIAGRRSAIYKILDHDGAFNFAKLNNEAVARFGRDRDLIMFLNNDVELSTPQALQTMSMQLLADPNTGFIGMKLYYPGGNEVQHGGIRLGAYVRGSGYYDIIHAGSPAEFVDAEHISLGVTFACAMTRRETFETLGGLDETFLPNAYGDVEMCLRAVLAGYRNYYSGSLSGIHHESKSRGHANEEIEFSCLHERHGQTLAQWRLRELYRSYRHAWPIRILPWDYTPQVVVPPPMPSLPLRYRVADKANAALKRGLGPAHGMMRSGATRAGAIYRRAKKPGAAYDLAKWIIGPIPLIGPGSRSLARLARTIKGRGPTLQLLFRHVWRNPDQFRRLESSYRIGGYGALREEAEFQLPELRPEPISGPEWFQRTRPSKELLAKLKTKPWKADAPRISVIMPVYNVREDWLRQAIESVIEQTYPFWELICVNDASPASHIGPVLDELASRDSRIRVIHCSKNRGVSVATNLGIEAAQGQYVSFMDHDDFLEPHALHRLAESILQEQPDMLYSDEAITGEDIEEIRLISARSAFSYDYYLSHPYFVHLIAARTDIIRRVGGLNEAMTISQDVDLVLRLIEVCGVVTHVPEVLYRWRTHAGSLGHQQQDKVFSMTRGALERHFKRMGLKVHFDDRSHFNFRSLRFQHAAQARVAILIPTKNRCDLLHACITSLERTVDPSIADIIIVDCESDHPNTTSYLAEVSSKYRLLRLRGAHNLPAIRNTSVAAVRGSYTHYLFLDQNTEAIDPGWLEHMLGYGQRTDIGIVGAVLLHEDERVQHGGIIIGMHGSADHAHKNSPFAGWLSGRNPGHNGTLLATREVSAVSGACMLTQADLFHRLNGFDERLGGGFSDVDYCLRAIALGYKVIQDAYSILYHLESDRSALDPVGQHHDASLRFREFHRELILKGDPFHSPMLPRYSTDTGFELPAVSGKKPRVRTTRVVLPPPTPTAVGKITRFDAEATGDLSPRPHLASRPGSSSVPTDSMKPRQRSK